MYKVIASGSTGNAVIYHDTIMVDCGLPFNKLSKYIKTLNIILLSHEHGDHLNMNTLDRILSERPSVRVGCGYFLKERLNGIKNVDIYEAGKMYDYGVLKICPVMLYHDVPSFGYRIYKDGTKIFHATDSAHLEGITAKGYSLYSIEANYDEDTVYSSIEEKQLRGEYAHQRGSINSHLSIRQAQDFVLQNGVPGQYEFIQLHQSTQF